jgi:superfamily II RNA helicase
LYRCAVSSLDKISIDTHKSSTFSFLIAAFYSLDSFDEVHMRDSDVIIGVGEIHFVAAPRSFVFLSITIPNASQFADWIADSSTVVVYTNYRPVPFAAYFPTGDGLHLVVDERGRIS